MSSNRYSTPSLFAVATGIVGSAWASGSIASITLVGIPTALASQQSSIHIWHGMFTRGMTIMPKIAVTVAISYVYAAYDAYNRGGYWKGYLAAGGTVVSIVPFTLIFMNSTNAALISSVTRASVLSQTQTFELIEKWGLLNLTRSILPLAGAATGMLTFLSNVL